MALKEIGLLWKKEGKNGKFLSGTLDLGAFGTANIGVFPIEKKESTDNKKPDARIMLFEDD